MTIDRRGFLHLSAATALAGAVPGSARAQIMAQMQSAPHDSAVALPQGSADHTIRIANGLVELAPDHIVSTKLYNGQFPGPLLRLKEGRPVVVDINNDTDTPEQLHWHGQTVPVDVDGAAEEGTPFIPAHGMRRISFTPGPAGLRFYHTHLVPAPILIGGQYSGQVGPVYIEPKRSRAATTAKCSSSSRNSTRRSAAAATWRWISWRNPARIKSLEDLGETAMRASLASGNAARLRGRLQPVLDQRPDARPRRADPRETRASACCFTS